MEEGLSALLPMFKKALHAAILFWMGLTGFVFYLAAPIVFPDIPSQPEVLPVLTVMMGIGQAAKGKDSTEEE